MQTIPLPEGTLYADSLPENFRPEIPKPRCICPTTEAGSLNCVSWGCHPNCAACVGLNTKV